MLRIFFFSTKSGSKAIYKIIHEFKIVHVIVLGQNN